MDEYMEDSWELTFTAVEIDLDYEFDAARYFDFCRVESLVETRDAELWFESAGTYPPSPFVTKLATREDILLENVNTSPKPKDAEYNDLSNVGQGQDFSVMGVNNGDCEGIGGEIFTNTQQCASLQKFQNQLHQLSLGLTFNNITEETEKTKTKCTLKPLFPRTSTLMKPTASQLAKQSQHQLVDSRFQKFSFQNKEKSSNNPCGVENQAAKRQKLEGGHLRKVAETKEQINLLHKAPKRDGTIDGSSVHAKLKLTIPREPNLETAHRAQRRRAKTNTEVENVTSTSSRFKALPLNRKILDAPSLFLPKRSTVQLSESQTSAEKGMQQTSAVLSSSSVYCNNSDKVPQKSNVDSIVETGYGKSRRPNIMHAPKQEKCETVYNFKARPLNRKILSSKGDIGVFRNMKREITLPMEFNFHTDKRECQHNLPIELFNKLSLTEHRPNAGSQFKTPQGSKENRLDSFQQQNEIKSLVKEKPPWLGGKQSQCGSEGVEKSSFCGMNRSLGIR